MKNALEAPPAWRQSIVILVTLPVVITLAVLAFAWPAGRIAPRDLPVGVVGTSTASQHAVEGLTQNKPGAFDFHLYPDQASAQSAIKDRDVYGAFVVTPDEITVLKASAASPTVADLLGTVGQELGDQATKQAAKAAAAQPSHAAGLGTKGQTPPKVEVRTVDVVALSADDPHGAVFSSALLPLTICSILIAAAIALLSGFRPAWRQLAAIPLVAALAGLGAYLIAQGFLGGLPHEHLATWAALSLTLLAISATAAGLIAVVGSTGLGIGAALMVFVGNPFSGVTSAPEMLPKSVDYIGQWLPPGAGANLLRSTAYFDGNGSAKHVVVLALWSVIGLVAIVVGHHTPVGIGPRAAKAAALQSSSDEPTSLNPQAHNPNHSHARHA